MQCAQAISQAIEALVSSGTAGVGIGEGAGEGGMVTAEATQVERELEEMEKALLQQRYVLFFSLSILLDLW